MPYKDKQKRKELQRLWYQTEKSRIINKSKIRRQRNRSWLVEQKRQPCKNCGNTFDPVCMDFHHRNPKTKLMDVGDAVGRRGRQMIIDEIAKCDLLCANCHRLHEYKIDR